MFSGVPKWFLAAQPSPGAPAVHNSGGTIFKSTDGGASWAPTFPGNFFAAQFEAVVIDPQDIATIYAAALIGLGVFKSTDGAASWLPSAGGFPAFSAVEAMDIDPSNPQILYATNSSSVARVFKTIDGGSNWSPADSGLPNIPIRALAVDPSHPSTVYAGTSNEGVFKTTDGGDFWVASSSGLPAGRGVVSFAIEAASLPPAFLVIDEDSIDNSTESIQDISFNAPFCGGPVGGVGDPGVCVNDDVADPAVRTPLFSRPLENPVAGGTTLVLPTGLVGDEALFRFGNPDPQVSLQGTPSFSTQEFITATGAAADENNLDKIVNVLPLGEAEIAELEGKTVCAVVYDSDVGGNTDPPYRNLKGANLGLTAFRVTAISPNPNGGSNLPLITVELVSSAEVQSLCESVASL